MILLDTTVLVYATGSAHPLREPCRSLVAAIGDGRLAASTTVEVIQEFAHVRARRRDRADAAATAMSFATLLAPLVMVDSDDLSLGLRVFREDTRVGAFDAVLAAAVMRRDHLTALVSADRAFTRVEGLTLLDPGGSGFLASVGL